MRRTFFFIRKLPTNTSNPKIFFAFLIFELTYLEEILQLEHELFPIYSKADEGSYQMVQIAVWTFLGAIPLRQELDNLFSRHQRDREYKHLQLRYLYLEGRYFIRSGSIKRDS